jgi:hypothetical protein
VIVSYLSLTFFSPHRFLLFLLPMTAAVDIECKFEMSSWPVVGEVYTCTLQKDPLITSPNVTIAAATESHQLSMSHADVTGFYSYGKTIKFMPRGLKNVFPNLIAVWIARAGMKELHQSDLKQFPGLKSLELSLNNIATLEEDLFKHNPELENINLSSNEITQIHPSVFDHLSRLSRLHLNSNVCIDAFAYGNNQKAALSLISRVKQECLGDIKIFEEAPQTEKP